jgi:ribosomal protein S18 acetylase RimI-like enzyme
MAPPATTVARLPKEAQVATQPVEVAPLAEEHVEAAASALARAFQPSPMFGYLFPNADERAHRSPGVFVQLLRYARRIGWVYAPVGAPRGAVLGWPMPVDETALADTPEDRLAAMPDLMGEEAFARFLAMITHVDAHQERLVPLPYWYLTVLGVDPDAQRQGLGSDLVRQCQAQAAAMGLSICLWTDAPQNVAFYRGLGMEVVGDGVFLEGDLAYWIFRWHAPPG